MATKYIVLEPHRLASVYVIRLLSGEVTGHCTTLYNREVLLSGRNLIDEAGKKFLITAFEPFVIHRWRISMALRCRPLCATYAIASPIWKIGQRLGLN